ncbi:MAG TPA: adenylate/guanylate cyclase domain-containing protein [Candidatus Limnocylindrales bacterium]|nr:adenylate/guanylate cyclase domain-containing protein [Candidatus Limnocylindrales bacterium]
MDGIVLRIAAGYPPAVEAQSPEPIVDPATAERWRKVLSGEDPGMHRLRGLLRAIPSAPRCKQCNSPFGGIGGPVMRLVGKAPWEKNPNFCGQCFTMLQRQFGGAEIELSMLFADVRGSTSLAERVGTRSFTDLLNRFYRNAAELVIGRDGLVDKFVGDEVVALFAPGWAGREHARRAIEAADAILVATGHGGGSAPWLPVGAGVHTGVAYVGTVGAAGVVTDFTALGDPVNATARLASSAAAGTILVSDDAATAAGLDVSGLTASALELRGRAEPMPAYVLTAGSSAARLATPERGAAPP